MNKIIITSLLIFGTSLIASEQQLTIHEQIHLGTFEEKQEPKLQEKETQPQNEANPLNIQVSEMPVPKNQESLLNGISVYSSENFVMIYFGSNKEKMNIEVKDLSGEKLHSLSKAWGQVFVSLPIEKFSNSVSFLNIHSYNQRMEKSFKVVLEDN